MMSINNNLKEIEKRGGSNKVGKLLSVKKN
jgi:hypothetical protein